MANLSDYFDEIYCINLDEETERWENFQQEVSKLGISNRVKRFSAIKDTVRGRGASLSHLELIKIARRKKMKNVFIFEDDTKFIGWNDSYLSCALDNLPQDWQLFNVGYNLCAQQSKLKSHRVSKHLIKIARGTDVRSNNAYGINSSAFNYVIKNYSNFFNKWQKHKFKWHLDLWYAQKFERYCLLPLVSVQEQGEKPQRFMDNFTKHNLIV